MRPTEVVCPQRQWRDETAGPAEAGVAPVQGAGMDYGARRDIGIEGGRATGPTETVGL